PRVNINPDNADKELESIRDGFGYEITYRCKYVSFDPIPDNTQNLLKQRPVISDLHLENLETNNQLRNRSLEKRHQNTSEPIRNSLNRKLDTSPRRINTITEPAHLLVHENKPSNKKRHCRNNQTNRVSLHRRVKNTHLNRSTRRGKLLSHQQAIPNSLTNSNRLQRQTVSRNATNNSGKDRPPLLEQAHNSRKNRRKLPNALNQRIRN